ncbi:MAG TPA: DUF4340 domain-containing protein [Polyangiaceae bacterium]|nr:DUF4340 domain-containing protein [Polyangiaceae bacterium]
MKTETKLYVALGVLGVLGGGLYLQNKRDAEAASRYTLSGQAAALPKIDIKEDDIKAIDKIVLNKAGEDGGAPVDIELTKSGEDWKLTKPATSKANQANVKSLLENLKTLKVTEQIDASQAAYAKHQLSDDKGLHAVFSKGDKPVLDVRFGETGGRGQMTRIAGKDGVYAVKGYSSYLYARDVKGWRDLALFKFEEGDVTAATIDNEHGRFSFTKDGEAWKGKFGKPQGAPEAIKDFDESKVKDFVRAYKALNADGFADKGKTPAEVGLEKPIATVAMTLKDGAKREVMVGANAEGSSRWVKISGSDEIWSISSWAADWATAEQKKFQKVDDKKDKDKKDKEAAADTPPPSMPPGMPPGGDPHGH